MKQLLVSPSPHIYSSVSSSSLMRDVIIALVPAILVSIVFYGWRAILVLATATLSAVLFEYLITRFLMKRPSTISDCSAIVTGLLLALNLPYTSPVWLVLIGSFFAIAVTKMSFGGLGQNIFNPAIAARVFLLISFPSYTTTWYQPKSLFGLDAISGATPLGLVKEGLMSGDSISNIMSEHSLSYAKMLFINIGGSAGELSAFALLLGFIYLLIRKVVKPYISLSVFASVALCSLAFWLFDAERFSDPIFNLLSGGLILGACFMATDYVTSPMSPKAGIIFGFGIGLITMMIRYFGSYPEGVSFAILIMNATVPLLNKFFHYKKYGR